MEQILDIGEYGDRVRLEGGRIAIHRADGTQAFVPLGDVAMLMFSEPGLSVSMAVLAELAKNGGTAVACDRTHTPVGIFQPLAALSRAAVSLRECLLSDSVELEIPVQVHEEDDDVDACVV